jgi:hypothetical protein
VSERRSDKVPPRMDEELEQETASLAGGAPVPSRGEEAREQEAAGDDQPDPDARLAGDHGTEPAPEMDRDDVEARGDLARHLEPSVFPATREELLASAEDTQAPPEILRALERLPEGATFQNVQDVWQALGGPTESR